MKILIVDDADQVCRNLEKLLRAQGYETLTARNGIDGIAAARKVGDIDLAICDYNLPQLDGLSMYSELKTLPGYAKLPAIFLSADTTSEIKSAAKAAGVLAWVVKPVNDESLVALVETILLKIRASAQTL